MRTIDALQEFLVGEVPKESYLVTGRHADALHTPWTPLETTSTLGEAIDSLQDAAQRLPTYTLLRVDPSPFARHKLAARMAEIQPPIKTRRPSHTSASARQNLLYLVCGDGQARSVRSNYWNYSGDSGAFCYQSLDLLDAWERCEHAPWMLFNLHGLTAVQLLPLVHTITEWVTAHLLDQPEAHNATEVLRAWQAGGAVPRQNDAAHQSILALERGTITTPQRAALRCISTALSLGFVTFPATAAATCAESLCAAEGWSQFDTARSPRFDEVLANRMSKRLADLVRDTLPFSMVAESESRET